MSNLSLSWPPHCTLKKNTGARHIRLKVSLQKGLEVIVPIYFNAKSLPALLDKHRLWIEKQLSQLLSKQESMGLSRLPTQVELRAIKMIWKIQYLSSRTKLQMLERPGEELVLLGNIEEKQACLHLLRSWLRRQAEQHLLSQLHMISAETGLDFKKASVRGQQRRWGSCSAKKAISLNYKLLFFPPELMRHVLIHELCHTVEMNHSDNFWNLVASIDPRWKTHRKAIRKAEQFIPAWVL